PVESAEVLRRARDAFKAGRTAEHGFRLAQLDALVRLVVEHECDFVDALGRDLHKVILFHLSLVPVTTALDESVVVSEPLGVVLIIGSWSSPVQQCLVPLVGAIAAGKTDSSSTDAFLFIYLLIVTSSFTASLLQECFHVLHKVTSYLPELVEQKFDHVFFTGSREEGTKVSQAAAQTLTPVTLVLRGKNPCYVDQQCEINAAARRIAWARFHNAGQSMVAPDYVLCHVGVKERLQQALRCALMQFYGSDPRESRSFGRIVTTENFNRVRDLLWRSGKVVMGGQVNEAERYIAPTIVVDVVDTDPIMQQEVSGPVLPIVTVQSVDEAIGFINKRDKPLCVYVYSSNSKVVSRVMKETSSGSFCSNDSVLQTLQVLLPFGGVGSSGIGCYHGRYSFDTFSHKKACLLRGLRVECMTYLRYPPYEDRNLSLATITFFFFFFFFLKHLIHRFTHNIMTVFHCLHWTAEDMLICPISCVVLPPKIGQGNISLQRRRK
uniref:Aldehyde dehydrogenase n=1 Tax=Denticeps clupeoides TaxID=299321 RepID=A0AAY4BVE8_9TELE